MRGTKTLKIAKNCTKKHEKLQEIAKNCQIAKIQKIAKKNAIFLKIAKNGQILMDSILLTFYLPETVKNFFCGNRGDE